MTAAMQALAFVLLCALFVWTAVSLVLMVRDERRARQLDRHIGDVLRVTREGDLDE